jgi:NAD(P)-dependent dehydrogenase (short-subunit alcohol dehydrogenase family)
MDYLLQGKIALVTGTASQVGMGKAICLTLAKEGCDIVSADINLEGAKQTAAAVKVPGHKAIAIKVDVAKSSEAQEMVNAALKEFGKIDILVNTVGIMAMMGVPFLESKPEIWEKDIAVNLYGAMNCARAVVPGMVERKYGKIINFSSIAAKLSGADSYAAAKAAILAFTRGLATQFGPSGINVNAISPGVVKTNFFTDGNNKRWEFMAELAPLRRIQTVEDIANATVFLASEVSKDITGQCIQVDSGMVML